MSLLQKILFGFGDTEGRGEDEERDRHKICFSGQFVVDPPSSCCQQQTTRHGNNLGSKCGLVVRRCTSAEERAE